MTDRSSVLRRASDVRYRILDDEGVVIRQEAAEAIVVNELGALWIDRVDGRRSVGEILDQLGAEYDIDAVSLEKDSLEYLDELVEIGLLAEAAPAGD